MSLAAEAELVAMYVKAHKEIPIQNLLHIMGHPQPTTLMQTDNNTALRVVNPKIQPRQTKAMDMRFHWLQDCKAQQQVRFFW